MLRVLLLACVAAAAGGANLSELAVALQSLPAEALAESLRLLRLSAMREYDAGGDSGGLARAHESMQLSCTAPTKMPLANTFLEFRRGASGVSETGSSLASQAMGQTVARRIRQRDSRRRLSADVASSASAAGAGAAPDRAPAGLACHCEAYACECTRACSCSLRGDGGQTLAAVGDLVPSPLENAAGVNSSEMHDPHFMFRCDCRFKVDASSTDFDAVACGCQREVCSCSRRCSCSPAPSEP